ncbi:MAG: hypothetical protein H6835_05615 [Planctomycetes bacterium]|nr:hypothetical protein [Planctomycetota bacterium]
MAAFCCSALVLLLPTLLVGLSLGDAPGPAELARVERALSPEAADGAPPPQRREGLLARQFLRAAIAGETWPDDATAQRDLVVRARIAQVAAVTALSLVLYLAVLLARGRLQALLACALFAALPPIASTGHVLRPEAPALLFALLSAVLLESAVTVAPRHRARRPRRSALLVTATMGCAALCAAFACAALPSIGEVLLVPVVLLLVVSTQLGVRAVRSLRRRGLDGAPVRALNRRLLPWLGLVLASSLLTVVVMNGTAAVAAEHVVAAARDQGLLVGAGFARLVASALAAVGLGVAVARVGLRFGRRGRVGADLVLFVWCALFLVPALREDGRDALPMAPAMAVLLSEGLRALLVGALLLRRRWRR